MTKSLEEELIDLGASGVQDGKKGPSTNEKDKADVDLEDIPIIHVGGAACYTNQVALEVEGNPNVEESAKSSLEKIQEFDSRYKYLYVFSNKKLNILESIKSNIAPSKFVSTRIALLKFASVIFDPARLAPVRSAPTKLTSSRLD